jgi:hypothetical protein
MEPKKNEFKLEIGKAVIGCVSAIVVACISGAVGVLTNWDKVQKFATSFNTSEVLFQDEFSNPNSGWEQYTDPSGNISDYVNGSYRLFVNENATDVYANPGKSFSNISVKVTTQYNGGPEDNMFGIICRYQDVDNYYELVISTDGYYGIGKTVGGVFSWLGADDMQASEFIHTGGSTNQIQADCVKDKLTLYANGHKLLETQDNSIATSGDIGLTAHAFDDVGVDISFDHLLVKKAR